MAITASQVNELRQLTGVGMMDCKKALVETDGDMQKAIELLRQKGQKMAAKRADRDANEGCVLAKTTGNYGALIMVSCETDFVATNAGFVEFTTSILDAAMANHLTSKEQVLDMNLNGSKVADAITDPLVIPYADIPNFRERGGSYGRCAEPVNLKGEGDLDRSSLLRQHRLR